MLRIRYSARSSSFVLPWLILSYSFALLFLLQLVAGQELLDILIPLTSPQIVYTPFVCNASQVAVEPQACAGAWQRSNASNAAQSTISTMGPSPASANIIPQMFFQFRASSIFLTTGPFSNATVNVTISANGVVISYVFDSSIGSISIINLPERNISLLTLTVNPSLPPTIFDLLTLAITIQANATISSILPAPTLPPSASLPIFSFPSSTSVSPSSSPTLIPSVAISKKTMIAQAVGLTVGIGLGLTFFAVIAFYYWKRRRRRNIGVATEGASSNSGWAENGRGFRSR